MLPIHSMSRRSIPLIARAPTRRALASCALTVRALTLLGLVTFWAGAGTVRADEVLPKHVNADTIKAVRAGLDYLAATQGSDGAGETPEGRPIRWRFPSLAGMAFLAHGNTPTRGHYAQQVQATIEYLLKLRQPSGLAHRPQPGHRAADARAWLRLMFLACVYGMETKESTRARIKDVVQNAVELTAKGQSGAGGWTYIPGAGDEGSVTVTQVQALRAHITPDSPFRAARSKRRCTTSSGAARPKGASAIRWRSGGGPRLAISAAAVATLYNAGEYDAPVAERCLEYVWQNFKAHERLEQRGRARLLLPPVRLARLLHGRRPVLGRLFPGTRDELLKKQDKEDGRGTGTASARPTARHRLIILQLPYKYLPVFQR